MIRAAACWLARAFDRLVTVYAMEALPEWTLAEIEADQPEEDCQ